MSTSSADDERTSPDVDDDADFNPSDDAHGAKASDIRVDGQLQASLDSLSVAGGGGGGSSEKQRPRRIKASTRERARRTALVDRYVTIYNEAVRDLKHDSTFSPAHSHSRDVQVGVVVWSHRERDALFRGLARYGTGDARRIASSIGPSKSEMEVRAYVQLLHDSCCARLATKWRPRLLERWAVPAAVEVSETACAAMETSARAMVEEQEHQNRILGKKKFGDLYVIDSGVAEWVEEHTKVDASDDENASDDTASGDDDDTIIQENHQQSPQEPQTRSYDSDGSYDLVEDSSMFTIARIFHISRWTRLSESVFMNFGQERLQDNWWHVGEGRESPALTCEAFADFYAHAVSITRRLIQSAIFMSMARIRSLAHASNKVTNSVTKEDMFMALDLLKMPRNAAAFWARVPRRHGLDVLDIRNRKGWKPVRLTHDQVEKSLLRRRKSGSGTTDQLGESDGDDRRHRRNGEQEDALDESSFLSEDADEDTDSLDSVTDGNDNETSDEDEDGDEKEFEQLSDREELKAESIDAHASREENLRLHRMLGLENDSIGPEVDTHMATPPQTQEDSESHDEESSESESTELSTEQEDGDEEDEESTSDSQRQRKATPEHVSVRPSREDLLNWRDRLLYFSEWEQFGPETPHVMTQFNRRKRRRIN